VLCLRQTVLHGIRTWQHRTSIVSLLWMVSGSYQTVMSDTVLCASQINNSQVLWQSQHLRHHLHADYVMILLIMNDPARNNNRSPPQQSLLASAHAASRQTGRISQSAPSRPRLFLFKRPTQSETSEWFTRCMLRVELGKRARNHTSDSSPRAPGA